jgi:hypothetical protein
MPCGVRWKAARCRSSQKSRSLPTGLNGSGAAIDANTFRSRTWNPITDEVAGERVHFHQVRDLQIRLLRLGGFDPRTIQSRVGHHIPKALEITYGVYGTDEVELDRKAAEYIDGQIFGTDEAPVEILVDELLAELAELRELNARLMEDADDRDAAETAPAT